MYTFRMSEDSISVSDWFPNSQKSFQSNGHDQEALKIYSNVFYWVQEVGEKENIDGGVDINKIVSNDDQQEQNIDDSKWDETLKNIENSMKHFCDHAKTKISEIILLW